MDCDACGFDCSKPDSLYHEDEEITCPHCGAVNTVSISELGDDVDVYVSSWRCVHGVPGDNACDQCEIEHGGGVGEVE